MTKRDIGFLYVWGGALSYLLLTNPFFGAIGKLLGWDTGSDAPWPFVDFLCFWAVLGAVGLWFWYWPNGRDKRRASLKTPQ